jgi:hypothetical protein
MALKLRAKSGILKGRIARVSPEFAIEFRSVADPGAVGIRLFVAPAPCRIVSGIEVHTTAGAGSSKVYLRRHLAAHVAAPNAAVSTTNIVDLVTGGVPADSTVNIPQAITFLAAAEMGLATGDKLMLVVPATYAGCLVQLYAIWTRD